MPKWRWEVDVSGPPVTVKPVKRTDDNPIGVVHQDWSWYQNSGPWWRQALVAFGLIPDLSSPPLNRIQEAVAACRAWCAQENARLEAEERAMEEAGFGSR